MIALPAIRAMAADRVALVVGCGNYSVGGTFPTLETPAHDAADLAGKLRSPGLGFDVIEATNVGTADFYARLRDFKTRAKGARIALFFYSGHGIEHQQQNYLLPVDATLEHEELLDTQAINLDRVMKDLGETGAAVKLAIVDCCRNDPLKDLPGWLKAARAGKGASSLEALHALGEGEIPQATLVCFATGAGHKALALLHPDSKNSPFTEFLIDELPKPGQSLRDIFDHVRDRLSEATTGRQEAAARTDNALSPLFRKTVLVEAKAMPATPEPKMVDIAAEVRRQVEAELARRAAAAATPAPSGLELAKLTTPAPLKSATSTNSDLTKATKEAPFVNSLGMKFVPVPGTKVLFSIWDTRVQDYAEYAKAKGITPEPSIEESPTYPVNNVSWDDAQAFCQWLSQKEGRTYRLPTDAEWSAAVGLGEERGSTPGEKATNAPKDVYPWGTQWPPPKGAGNYADESLKKAGSNTTCIAGYTDGYAYTSPVGSFPANRFGLYDMGGNVWQWCNDWYDAEHDKRVLRGGSWVTGDPTSMPSSNRGLAIPANRGSHYGFRCVLVASGN